MFQAVKGMVEDTTFLRKILVIGVPVALQGLLIKSPCSATGTPITKIFLRNVVSSTIPFTA